MASGLQPRDQPQIIVTMNGFFHVPILETDRPVPKKGTVGMMNLY